VVVQNLLEQEKEEENKNAPVLKDNQRNIKIKGK